jgi:hypothetical protein
MQSDPVKNVSLTGLVGLGRQVDNANAKTAGNRANGGEFTARLRRLTEEEAVAVLGRNVGAAVAASAIAASSVASVEETAVKPESDADGTINIEVLMRLARLAASAGNDGGGAEDVDASAEAGAITHEDKLRMGNELISYALKQLATILGLPEEGGESADFQFDADNIEQLAAIMAYLDLTIKMANDRIDVSANAESANIAMAAYGMESPIAHIEPEENAAELSEFAAALRTEKFRLDMAFSLIGVSGMIADKMAEASGTGTATGIPQAVNPASLGMSVADTVSAFSNLIKEELSASADRVRQIARGQAEMTGLERAAVELGTVKSEILKAALNKANPDMRSVGSGQWTVYKTGVDTNINTTANAEVAVDAAPVSAANRVMAGQASNDARADAGTDSNIGVNTVGVKVDVNSDDKNVNAGNNAGASKETVLPPTRANGAAPERVSVQGLEIDVKGNAVPEAKINVNTADVKTGVNVGTNKNVNTALGATVPAALDVNSNVEVNAAPANAGTGNGAAIKTGVSTTVKTDVGTEAGADVETVSDAGKEIAGKARHDGRSEAKAGVDTADVRTGTEKNVNTALGATVPVARNVNANVGVDTVPANAGAGNGAAVKTDVNTTVDTDVNKEAGADVNTAGVKAGIDKSVKTEAGADVAPASDVDRGTGLRGDKRVASQAGHDDGVEASAGVKGKRPAVAPTELPISAHESAGGRKRSNVESANRRASKSAELATGARPSSAGESAELPVSVMALAAGKKTVGRGSDAAVAEPKHAVARAEAQAKNTVADGEGAELPVSVMESAEKKRELRKAKSGNVVGNAKAVAKEAAKAAVAAAESAKAQAASAAGAPEDEVFAAKMKQAADISGFIKNIGGKAKASGDPAAKPAASAVKGQAPLSGSASANSAVNGVRSNTDVDIDADTSSDGGVTGGTESIDMSRTRAAVEARHAEKSEAAALSQNERLEVIRQLSEKLSNAVRVGANEVRLTLRPEALGEVRMSLRVQGDVVFAKMQVENKQVKSIVESNMQSLKDSLARQNLEFGAIDVEVGAQSDGDKSPRELWQEMAERSESRGGFREGVSAETAVAASDGFVDTPLGSETGRRFGDNTFEYFA